MITADKIYGLAGKFISALQKVNAKMKPANIASPPNVGTLDL